LQGQVNQYGACNIIVEKVTKGGKQKRKSKRKHKKRYKSRRIR